MKLLPLLALLTLAVPAPQVSAATLLFDDNFDGPPYSDNANLLTGANRLDHGIWGTNNTGNAPETPETPAKIGGTTTTSTAQAFSGTRSLALSVGPDTGQAQAIARFSEDGENQQTLTEGFTLRFAFLRTSADFTSTFYLTGGGGQSALIYIGNTLDVYHKNYQSGQNPDRHRIPISLAANTWYQFEITMPTLTGNPNPQYTVTLYDTNGQWLADSTGNLYTPATSYSWFTFYHSTLNKTFHLDNVTVAPIPEPATTALLLSGLGIGLLWYRRCR